MYTREELEQIVRDEEELCFDAFGREDAMELAHIVFQLASREHAGICCQVVLDNFEVIRFFLPGTDSSNIIWLTRKKNSVLVSGWSSLRCGMEAELNGIVKPWHADTVHYVIRGGGFPIHDGKGRLFGALCVSGLAHPEDHRLCVQALREYHSRIKEQEARS